MRCPKCHYLSFDPESRCKNCGYDLEVADTELALRTAEEFDGEALDLQLSERVPASAPHSAVAVAPPPRVRRVAVAERADSDLPATPPRAPSAGLETAPFSRAPFRAPHTTTDLPLFVKALAAREELPNQPAAPRPPLSVRRTVSDTTRGGARTRERRLGPLDNDLLEDLLRVEKEEAAHGRAEARVQAHAHVEIHAADRVPPSQRLGAAALDGLILGGISTFVLWATLRLLAVGPSDLGVASIVPLAIFLGAGALLYVLMFTAAGGQTVGKMLMGIRVVVDAEVSGDDRLTLGQAAWRASLAFVSILALGMGWIPALFGRGLALHDRLAHTRVVRA